MRLRELYSVGIYYIIVMKVNRVAGDTKLSIVLDVNNVTKYVIISYSLPYLT